MSHSLSGMRALLLGLVVVGGLALAGGGLFLIGGRGWYGSGAFHVRASFREVRGVEVGTRVRLKGMDAGEVVEVVPPARMEDPVVLRLLIKGDYRGLLRPDAVVRITSDGLVGGKVLEIQPGAAASGAAAGPVAEDQMLQGDSSDLLADVGSAVSGVQAGKGTLGKLAADTAAFDSFVDMERQGTKTLQKIEGAADALRDAADSMKRLPYVGAYLEDPSALLQRYNLHRKRRFFAAGDLFEPGLALLTAEGKTKLDGLAPWLEETKAAGSDVVIVAYADPKTADAKSARMLTRQQSAAVCDYLKAQHGVEKTGWFSSRTVTPLGMGVEPPPTPETEPLPPDRVEVQVFTP